MQTAYVLLGDKICISFNASAGTFSFFIAFLNECQHLRRCFQIGSRAIDYRLRCLSEIKLCCCNWCLTVVFGSVCRNTIFTSTKLFCAVSFVMYFFIKASFIFVLLYMTTEISIFKKFLKRLHIKICEISISKYFSNFPSLIIQTLLWMACPMTDTSKKFDF